MYATPKCSWNIRIFSHGRILVDISRNCTLNKAYVICSNLIVVLEIPNGLNQQLIPLARHAKLRVSRSVKMRPGESRDAASDETAVIT
jgi:hypothetical protein